MNTGYLLMNISKRLKHDLNQALIEKGITVQQWAVIQQIYQRKQVTATELVQLLDMDKPTASGIVQRLEKKGLLAKSNNPSDKRSFLLSLTATGKEILKECKNISDSIVEKHISVLSIQEQEVLNDLLSKISPEKENL